MNYMLILINTVLSFAVILGMIQLIKSPEFYQKLTSFFYVVTNLTIIILISLADNIYFILDIVIILFLLELLMIVTFLSNKIKIISGRELNNRLKRAHYQEPAPFHDAPYLLKSWDKHFLHDW